MTTSNSSTLTPNAQAAARAPRPTGANAAHCRSGGHPPVDLIPAGAGAAPMSALAGSAPRPTLAPSPATIERYPALAGRPDLTNHNQVIEAIGYHDLALRLSKRARWTRAERAAIAAATAKVVADARTSHQRALAIWSEIAQARGMQMLSDAQDAAIAAQDRAA